MFNSARLKLTGWYLLIIVLISIFFSVLIYTLINSDYSRIERAQKLRQEQSQKLNPYFDEFRRSRAADGEIIPPMSDTYNAAIFIDARKRLQAILVLLNLGILTFAGVLAYFLAGRTLRPIREMVDEQNRFITDSSHELRTPLTSLKSEIEVNLRNKNLNLNEAKQLLESNLEEVNNLQYLSDNLIKLTQYKKSDTTIFESISILDTSIEATKKISSQAKNKNITIKNNIKDLKLIGDRQNLLELFVIILDNAIKYSPEKTTIALTDKKIDHSLEIKIADQGMGIEKEDLPHLFDRFYRADKSRTKEGTTGYGLGLSIAKQIIDKHSGSIKVESSDKGTTFIIQLPFRQ